MSRPDIAPHDLDGWLNTAYLDRLRANHDTLAQRTRAATEGRAGGGRRAALFFVAIVVVVVVCAGLRMRSPLFTEPHGSGAPAAPATQPQG